MTHFDHSVTGARGKPLIARIDRESTDPSHVARNDPCQFPFRTKWPISFTDVDADSETDIAGDRPV